MPNLEIIKANIIERYIGLVGGFIWILVAIFFDYTTPVKVILVIGGICLMGLCTYALWEAPKRIRKRHK